MAGRGTLGSHGPLVTLTMNRPEQRNPLTGNTAIPEFLAAIDRIHDDPHEGAAEAPPQATG